MAVTELGTKVISTGNNEIDKKLGGGIPLSSLVLMEGQSDAGKSVVCQHFTFGALTTNINMAYYTTENTVKSLLSQMASLNLDITDYFLCDRMRIYPVVTTEDSNPREVFQSLLEHFDHLPVETKLVIVDSLTGLLTHGDERATIDFFSSCNRMCDYVAAQCGLRVSLLCLRRQDVDPSSLPMRRPLGAPNGAGRRPFNQGNGSGQGP